MKAVFAFNKSNKVFCRKEKNIIAFLKQRIRWSGDAIKTWKLNNLYKRKITEVATKNPSWISENATALSAIDKMTNLNISSLLVSKHKDINKKNKKVFGIITMLQCLRRGIK